MINSKLFNEFEKDFIKKNTPYMIVDDLAVLLYGEPRLTRDIVITLGVESYRMNDIAAIAKTCA